MDDFEMNDIDFFFDLSDASMGVPRGDVGVLLLTPLSLLPSPPPTITPVAEVEESTSYFLNEELFEDDEDEF